MTDAKDLKIKYLESLIKQYQREPFIVQMYQGKYYECYEMDNLTGEPANDRIKELDPQNFDLKSSLELRDKNWSDLMADRIKSLEAEVERLKLEKLALLGNLGHPVPSGLELPVVERNVLAEFIAKERELLRSALEKIANAASWGVAPAGVIKFLVEGEWKEIRSFARDALKGQG